LVGVQEAALVGVAEEPGATLAAAHAAAAASAGTGAGKRAAVEATLVAGDAELWTSTTAPIMLHFCAISQPPVSAMVATAAAPTATTTLMRVLVVRAARVTTVRKTRVMAVARAGTKVRPAPVLVVVLAMDLMFVLLELAPSVTILELQAMVAPQVNAKEATAAERTVKTAMWRVEVVLAANVTAVCKTGLMAMARAVTKAERTPVLAVTVLLDRLLELVELALVTTRFELGGMAPTTANTRVAIAAAHTATPTLMHVLVVRAAIVPEVGKMGVVAVTGAGTKVRRAPVLVLVLVLDLMLVLLELAKSVTILELQAMVAPQVNAK